MLFPLKCCRRRVCRHGFTLIEVVITIGIVALVMHGTISGYVFSANRAEWSAYSLAAQSLAMQGVEQARAAKWDPQAWPVVDALGTTNYTQVSVLDVPVTGTPVFATNYVSISTVSANPPLRELRTDCVWRLNERGPFTNSIVTLRAPDQ
jgi:prepilin-type N-terminal cleavage/methylation domain-containing protein